MKPADRATAEGILFTDQYELTMAHLYYRLGLHERESRFDYFFRTYPDYGQHKAGYCIAAGLEWLLDWMQEAHFRGRDLEFLRSQRGQTGKPTFAPDFLDWLGKQTMFECINLSAIPEGRVVHPNVPVVTVDGPLAMAQILETSLLNHLNYQTLVATRAARMHQAGRGRPLLEFGLRRAQDKGANAGTRAALIGGADYTSNAGISHVLGYPPKGTQAHSMIQAFLTLGVGELGAFRAYADLYPDDCLLLVDTVNTLESGIPNAITVFEELRRRGHRPVGIRLDSGNLAYLAVRAAKMLSDAGFAGAVIVLSNELDELVIWQIITQITQEARRYDLEPDHVIGRLVYGVGTRLITSYGDAALGGVYKLAALRTDGEWRPSLKISETPEKTPNPGRKNAWRIYDRQGVATADLLSLEDEDPLRMGQLTLRHPTDPLSVRVLGPEDVSAIEPLLVPVLAGGSLLVEMPPIEHMRQRRREDLERLDPGIKRIVNPHLYHVSLTEKLWELKQTLIAEVRANGRAGHRPPDLPAWGREAV